MSQQNARRLGSDEYRKRTSGRTLIIVAATSGVLLFATGKPVMQPAAQEREARVAAKA
jgi:hypothetical protein